MSEKQFMHVFAYIIEESLFSCSSSVSDSIYIYAMFCLLHL